MSIRTFIAGLVAVISCAGCINQTYFGESTQANITTFTIQGAMSTKIEPLIDWQDVGTIDVTVPSTFDLDSLKVTSVKCSELARFDSDPMLLTDFLEPIELWVMAESGVRKKWVITATKQQTEPVQIPFSSFRQWTPGYNLGGKMLDIKGQPGYWPGDGKAESPWQTSAQGNVSAAQLGGAGFSVVPIPTPTSTTSFKADYSRVQTIFAGDVAKTQKMGMAAGGVFTGVFVMYDVTYAMKGQTRKMMNLGTPFYSKPKGVRFDIRYKGGAQMVDGNLNPITWPVKDSCDVLFALQNRLTTPNQWIRVATAAMRSPAIGDLNADVAGFVRYEMPFVYGTPTAADMAAKPYQQIGGSQGELFYYTFAFNNSTKKWEPSENPVKEVYATDPNQTDVDHILVLFSSSTYGDVFKAAIGSTLDIKNIELIY